MTIAKELALGHGAPNPSTSELRWSTARSWHREAVDQWIEACELVVGSPVQIEWMGDTAKPMCIVNGALMFA